MMINAGWYKRRLERLEFFGLVDRMEDSAILFADRFDVPPFDFAVRENTSKLQLDCPPDVAEFYAMIHDLDMELYSWAEDLFDERLDRFEKRRNQNVQHGSVCSSERQLEVFLSTDQGLPPLQPADYRYSQSGQMFTSNFDERFLFEPINRWVRWVKAGKQPKLFLPKPASSATTFSIEVPYCTTLDVRDGLALAFNGETAPVTRTFEQFENGDYFMLLHAEIPKTLAHADAQYVSVSLGLSSSTGGLEAPVGQDFCVADFWIS